METKRKRKAHEWVFEGLYLLGSIGVLGILTIVFVNVIMRYVLNSPLHWAEEVTSVTLVPLCFFPAAELWRKKSHITFDLISKRYCSRYPKVDRAREGIICLVGLVFSALLIWETAKNLRLSYVLKMGEPSILGTPLWLLYLFMLLGSAALFTGFTYSLIRGSKGADHAGRH